MMDDDAWKSYTDETLEQLEVKFKVTLEFRRRARFLRSQGFSCRRIAERLNELGVKDPQGRSPSRPIVYNHTKDIALPHSHANGGRQWSKETRRRVDEEQEAKRNGFWSVDAYNDWKLRYQAMRARFSDD